MKVYTLVQETRDDYELLNTSVLGVFSSEKTATKRIMEINPNAEVAGIYDDCVIYEGQKETKLGNRNQTLFYTWTINMCNVID